jgi:ABC-2 type transport system ATP-binding protein
VPSSGAGTVTRGGALLFPTPKIVTTARGDAFGSFVAIDHGVDGALYAVWSERHPAVRETWTMLAASRDGGTTWDSPVHVDSTPRTTVFPWVTAGDAGRVAVSYYGTDSTGAGDVGGHAPAVSCCRPHRGGRLPPPWPSGCLTTERTSAYGGRVGDLRARAAVDLQDVSVRRGNRDVVLGITSRIDAGQVVGLLGPSGCGKTTLMRCIVGVQAHVRGSVTVLGRPAGAPALRPLVGYVTQAPSVYGDLTVRQNLDYFAALLRVRADVVEETLRTVRLAEHARSRVDRLSGGQRARVSLATALLARPELLVLDEPTVGLDPVLREDLWSTFRSLAAAGTTLLVSSHVMDEASRCDRLLLMRDGALIADDTPLALLTRTSTPDLEHAFLSIVRAEERS